MRNVVVQCLTFCLLVTLSHASCYQLNASSICYGLLPYSSVWISETEICPTNATVQLAQSWVETVLVQQAWLWAALTPSCSQSYAVAACAVAYPECVSNAPVEPCSSVCDAILDNTVCDSNDTLLLSEVDTNNVITSLNCTGVTGSCNSIASSFVSSVVVPKAHCEPYSGTLCNAIVTYDVWIAWNGNQSTGESVLVNNGATLLLKLAAAYHNDSLGVDCITAISKFACGQAFPRCDRTALSRTLGRSLPQEPVFQRPPCREACIDYSYACPGLLQSPLVASSLGRLTPSCDSQGTCANKLTKTSCTGMISQCGTVVYNGNYDFPVNETQLVPAPPQSPPWLVTYCNDFQGAQSVALSCVGLVVPDDNRTKNTDLSCALPCPARWHFFNSTWDQGIIMTKTIGSIGFVMTTFMFLTWIIFPSKRRQTFVLCFNVCVWLLALFILIPFNQDLPSLGCADNSRPIIHQDGSFCSVQGFVLHYFVLVAVLWWWLIALHLFLTVVRQKKFSGASMRNINVIFLFIAWGLPGIAVVFTVSFGVDYGGSIERPLLICLFHNPGHDWVEYTVFYAPIGVLTITGFGLILAIMWALHRAAVAAGVKGTTRWKRQIRPLIFVMQFFFIFFCIFLYRIQAQVHQEGIQAAALVWFQCLNNQGGSYQTCGPRPSEHLSEELWLLLFFVLASQGIINFLSWGTQMNNIVLWWNLIRGRGVLDTGGTSGSGDSGAASPRVTSVRDLKPQRSKSNLRRVGSRGESERVQSPSGSGPEQLELDTMRDGRDKSPEASKDALPPSASSFMGGDLA